MKNLMLKIFFTVLFALSVSSVSFALPHTIDESELYIGGIGIGTSLDYVEKIYGEPTSKEPFKNYLGTGITYNYNDFFLVSALYTKSNNTYVNYITCKESILSTPSGFAVGVPYAKVTEKYGKVSILTPEITKNLNKNYIYYEHYIGLLFMRFAVDKNGIIQEIDCFMDT